MSSWRGVASRARVPISAWPHSPEVAANASRGAGAGDHGRSKFFDRAESMTKSPQWRHSASDDGCPAIRRRLAAACDDECGASAIFFESLRRQHITDRRPVSELADAAGRVANNPLLQAFVVHVSAIGIGREPFAHCKAVAADVMDGEPAVVSTNRETASVAGDQHVQTRRQQRAFC